jgi:phthalate 4,5-dioxygenase oxygenase subunit
VLTRYDNDLLTQTDLGTLMGETMRRYWMPALLSSEIPAPDCPPVRVQLLGERLVAFRDTSGRIGLINEFCPHRLTSMFLGRNEEDGLRCVYHGWKFDVNGTCLDMMNEPPGSDYKDKMGTTAYTTCEVGGLVWAHMGPKDKTPALPLFEWTQVPATHRQLSKNIQECNWLQSFEGGIDTAHAPILHRRIANNTTQPGFGIDTDIVRSGPPKVEVETTDYGYRYAGIRPMGETGNLIRSYQWIMPFTQIRPQQFGLQGEDARPVIAGHMWVPMDDNNCMVYNWSYSFGEEPLVGGAEYDAALGRGDGDLLPDFRNIRNRDNDWLIDRQVQKYETFTGITGINNQDQAVQESMGAIVDRSKEHLSASDMAIVTARRILLQAARTVADGGDPPGVGTNYYNARAIDKILPADGKWKEDLLDEMNPA